MGVASREKTIGGWKNRPFLDRDPQPREGLFETPAEKQGGTDQPRTAARLGARAEPQRPTGVFDRQIRLPGPQSEKAADVPAVRVTRIKGEGAVDQHDHRIDVLAETGKGKSGVRQDARVVSRDRQGAARKVDALLPVRIPIQGGAVADEVHAPASRQGERRSIIRIASDRRLERLESWRGW